MEYLTYKRIMKAKELILKDIPINQLSKTVGFKDYSNFYKAFKKITGLSPRQYKENIRENSQMHKRYFFLYIFIIIKYYYLSNQNSFTYISFTYLLDTYYYYITSKTYRKTTYSIHIY